MPAVSRFATPEIAELPDDVRSRILAVQEKSGFVPNVFLALARRPDEFRAFFAYHDALMEKKAGLTKAEREMIVVATSAVNNCLYCVVAHGAILRFAPRIRFSPTSSPSIRARPVSRSDMARYRVRAESRDAERRNRRRRLCRSHRRRLQRRRRLGHRRHRRHVCDVEPARQCVGDRAQRRVLCDGAVIAGDRNLICSSPPASDRSPPRECGRGR